MKTPGREDDEEAKLYIKADYLAKKVEEKEISKDDVLSNTIMKGLGGKKNISSVDCCATRLRITVKDANLVRDGLLKSTDAAGVVHDGKGVQIIYGPHVTLIKANFVEYLETAPNTIYLGEDVSEASKDTANQETKTVSKEFTIYSPMTGVSGNLSEADDKAFAEKMIGDGAIVTPKENTVVAPCDGTISFVFDTKHAIGMETEDGIGLLLHVGVDTLTLNGEGFKVFVENGQKVKKGDILMELDLDFLRNNTKSMTSFITIPDIDESKIDVFLIASGEVKAGDPLYSVTLYE